MHDTWLGLERWLKSIKNEPNPKFLNSDEVLGIAKGSDEGRLTLTFVFINLCMKLHII
jgi:hypothetical protein